MKFDGVIVLVSKSILPSLIILIADPLIALSAKSSEPLSFLPIPPGRSTGFFTVVGNFEEDKFEFLSTRVDYVSKRGVGMAFFN